MNSMPGSSVHGISREGILEWDANSFSRDLPNPVIESVYPAWQSNFLPYIYIYMGIYIYIYAFFLIYILYICIWVAVLFVFVTCNADKTLSTSYRSPLDNCWWKLFDKKLSLLLPKASFLKHIMFPTWVYSLFKYLFTIMETQMMCSLIWLDKN